MPSPRLIKFLLLLAVVLAGTLVTIGVSKQPAVSTTPFAPAIDKTLKMSVQVGTHTLVFQKETTDWNVSLDSGATKADIAKIQALQSDLKRVEVEDVISEGGTPADDFQVNPGSATVVVLYDKNSTVLASGIFGKQANDGAHIYFRYPHKSAIYLARGRVDVEPDIAYWRAPAPPRPSQSKK